MGVYAHGWDNLGTPILLPGVRGAAAIPMSRRRALPLAPLRRLLFPTCRVLLRALRAGVNLPFPQVSGLGTPKALRTKTPGAAGYLPPIGGGGRSSKDFSAVDDELDDVDDDDGPFRAAGTRARPAEVQGASLSDSGARHGAKAGMRSSASDSNLF